mgnify:CR=1 FL=1
MNLPNLISLGRLGSVPIVVWLILGGQMKAAFWVFLIAALSDAVDGILAKQMNAETEFGAYLDPIADKALLVGAYLTLGHEGIIQTWLVIMVVFRDLVIVGGAILYHTVTQALTMQPLMISKVNTFVQLIFAIAVLWIEAYRIEDGFALEVIGYIVAITTLWSGIVYVATWSQMASAMESSRDNPGAENPEE